MRLSGQATTAIGNVITNMQVHLPFILRNYNTIIKVFMLGDDNLMMLSEQPSITNLKREIK